MANFAKKMREFTDELEKQKLSDEVQKLNALVPYLLSYSTRNRVKGNISGLVIQAGSSPHAAWDAANQLVATIGSQELTKRFDKAWKAAQENATTDNKVGGNVTGTVLQLGNVTGDINIHRRDR